MPLICVMQVYQVQYQSHHQQQHQHQQNGQAVQAHNFTSLPHQANPAQQVSPSSLVTLKGPIQLLPGEIAC